MPGLYQMPPYDDDTHSVGTTTRQSLSCFLEWVKWHGAHSSQRLAILCESPDGMCGSPS